MENTKLIIIAFLTVIIMSCSKNNNSPNTGLIKPIAKFESNYDGVTKAPVQTSFTNKSKNANSYIWDFGDGSSTSNSQYTTVWHTYYNSGIYTVTLSAIGDPGDTSFTVGLVMIK
jgi:PKD repeat protein